MATTAFRVAQEALTNVARHSGVKQVCLARRVRAGKLQIEVCDDGGGFQPDRLPLASSGLMNLRERLRLSGGEFSVASAPGEGTKMTASIPLRGLTSIGTGEVESFMNLA